MDWVAAYDGDRSVEVPAQLLQAGHRYEFVLELRNFLGFGAVSPPWTFTVAAGAKPEVLITGGTRQTTRRPLALTVFAEASVAACPGEKVGSTSLSYVWTSESFGRLVSESRDPRFFKLGAYALNSTISYAFSVVVVDAFGQNNSASVTIAVGESSLVAAIDGGNRIVSVVDDVALDASASLDPDVRGRSGAAARLSFVWSCVLLDASSGGACPNDDAMAQSETIAVPAASLGAGTFRFSAMAISGARNTSASVEIEVVIDTVPRVSIDAMAIAKANPSQKLVLVGAVGPDVLELAWVWSLSAGSLAGGALGTLASTTLDGIVSPACAATGCVGDDDDADSASTAFLVLPAGAVTPGATCVYSSSGAVRGVCVCSRV